MLPLIRTCPEKIPKPFTGIGRRGGNVVTAPFVSFIVGMDANPAVRAVLSAPELDPIALQGRSATEAFAQKLVQEGAIMTVPGRPGGQALIGDLRWSEGSVCWFTAFGDSPGDAHRLDFTEAHVVQRHGISFLNGRVTTARLSTIDAADLEDPDDYRVAWQLWQQVAPLRAALIENCYSRLQA
jgi:hypothetical protein